MTTEGSRGKDVGRTLQMLAALMNGERLDAKVASERFGIRKEGALRNLKLLERLVPGVTHEPNGARHEFIFTAPDLKQRRAIVRTRAGLGSAIAMSLGAAFRVFAGTPYQTELEQLRREVIERLPTGRRQHFSALSRKFTAISGGEEVLQDKTGILDDVVDAVLRHRVVRMRYRSFEGIEEEKSIRPYSLVVYDEHLYVVGVSTDIEGKRPKPYRFARILELEVLDDSFPYPSVTAYDPAQLFEHSIGIWSSDPEPCRIRVRFAKSWAVYIRHHRWHRSQEIVAELSDGRVEVEMVVRPCPEFEQWVLRFGDDVEVIAPEATREKIALRLRKAARQYETAHGEARAPSPAEDSSSTVR